MPDIENIYDLAGLEAWFDAVPDKLRKEWAVFIASRAALRVAPLIWNEFITKQNPRLFDTRIWYLIASARSSRSQAAGFATTSLVPDLIANDVQSTSAVAASQAAVNANSAAQGQSSAVALAVRALDNAAYAANRDFFWECVGTDAEDLIRGGETSYNYKLWGDHFFPYAKIWHRVREVLVYHENWSFWIDWYEAQLDGRPMLPDSEAHWEMLAEIFEVSDTSRFQEEDWDKGADHINPLIHEIYLKYLGRATYNAERIEENPATHLLRAISESDMVPEFLRDTVDRLQDAAAIFGDVEALDNQYQAIQPDLEFLQEKFAKYADRPLRLHDSALQVVRRLEVLIANNECPTAKQDPLIADFQSELLGAVRDIQAQDDRVRQVVQARLKAKLGNTTEEDRAAIIEGVVNAEEITEGDLKTELREDYDTLCDPHASPEATRQALWRLTSRLIRISAEATKLPADVIKNVTIIGGGIGLAVTVVIRLLVGG